MDRFIGEDGDMSIIKEMDFRRDNYREMHLITEVRISRGRYSRNNNTSNENFGRGRRRSKDRQYSGIV